MTQLRLVSNLHLAHFIVQVPAAPPSVDATDWAPSPSNATRRASVSAGRASVGKSVTAASLATGDCPGLGQGMPAVYVSFCVSLLFSKSR